MTLEPPDMPAPEGIQLTFTCSADSSNPRSQVNWKLAGVNITAGIITDYELCEHNAYCVHSQLQLTAGRAMNGEDLNCYIIYEDVWKLNKAVQLNISCELTPD